MFEKGLALLGARIGQLGHFLTTKANAIALQQQKSIFIEEGADRDLYQTRYGFRFWLNEKSYLDRCIVEHGIFEPDSTALVQQLVKPGDYVFDVGANIGYYSVIFSRLVAPVGKVVAFEPTAFYGEVLKKNLLENHTDNVEVYRFGLSDKSQELIIQIGESSATLHSPGGRQLNTSETIRLMSLDEFIQGNEFPRLDFIKVDIDGHEPQFLEGAWKTIDKYDPIILLEVNHLNYIEAGCPAWDLYSELMRRGFRIYHERGLEKVRSQEEFLIKCANFAYSSNIVVSRKNLS